MRPAFLIPEGIEVEMIFKNHWSRTLATTLLTAAALGFGLALAEAATIVALGASNTYGKGVARNQAYPAQLQAILQASGKSVRVINAGINGDTTEGMLRRLDRAVPNGTSVVILQPGGNDRRKGTTDRTSEIQSRLSARGIPVVMLGNSMLSGLPKQPDGVHLTPEGYQMLAKSIAPSVQSAMSR
jgi:acyl-CoA thioesterase-1